MFHNYLVKKETLCLPGLDFPWVTKLSYVEIGKPRSLEIGEVVEDDASIPSLAMVFDGEEIHMVLDECITVSRLSKEMCSSPPQKISPRNQQWFGDYWTPAPPSQPREIVEVTFQLYRAFEDEFKEAYFYLRKAEDGDVGAQAIIAKMYYHGIGIRKSRKEARYWLGKAEENRRKSQ